jgi:hypothetical protein
MTVSKSIDTNFDRRFCQLDWALIAENMCSSGFALTPVILSESECRTMASMFDDDKLFRKVIDMAKHSYGSGVYKYFKYPLPEPILDLRRTIYQYLAPIANSFSEALKLPDRYPSQHVELIEHCHRLGQLRPTPLLLHYEKGDFNRLHQDVYGEFAFPLQLTAFLSRPGADFRGGEFLIQEQTPRMQSRVHVLKPEQGQMIIFTTRFRPEKTRRGFRKVNVRHGVGTVESGRRYTLGIPFHDAL